MFVLVVNMCRPFALIERQASEKLPRCQANCSFILLWRVAGAVCAHYHSGQWHHAPRCAPGWVFAFQLESSCPDEDGSSKKPSCFGFVQVPFWIPGEKQCRGVKDGWQTEIRGVGRFYCTGRFAGRSGSAFRAILTMLTGLVGNFSRLPLASDSATAM